MFLCVSFSFILLLEILWLLLYFILNSREWFCYSVNQVNFLLSISLVFSTISLNTHFHSIGSIMFSSFMNVSGFFLFHRRFANEFHWLSLDYSLAEWKGKKSYRFSKFFNTRWCVTYTLVINYFIRHLCAFIMICCTFTFILPHFFRSLTSHCLAHHFLSDYYLLYVFCDQITPFSRTQFD